MQKNITIRFTAGMKGATWDQVGHDALWILGTIPVQMYFTACCEEKSCHIYDILVVYLLFDRKLLTSVHNSDYFLKQTKMSLKGMTWFYGGLKDHD